MNVDKTPSSPRLQPLVTSPPHVKHQKEKEPGTAPQESSDITDLYKCIKPNGMLPIILTSVPEKDMERIKKVLGQKYKAQNISDLPLVDGISLEISPDKLKKLVRILPHETGVSLDRPIEYPNPTTVFPHIPSPEIVDPFKGPGAEKLEPRNVHIETLGMEKVWEKGYTGKGVTVCVIDSGIYSHEDFDGRIIGWKDMTPDGKTRNYDPFGHGTHVSGILAGSGKASSGKVKGIAPEANLVGVRITSVSEAIKALQWAIENKNTYGIKVINMSLGDYAIKSYKDDPWAQAAEKAIDAGMIVVVAAGNEGPKPKSVSTPGIDPRVITVASLNDRKTEESDDDAIADNSSRGPTNIDGVEKPDVSAFGVNIYSTLSPGSKLDIADIPHIGKNYIAFSGTSMATPMVSGLCALLVQANPNLTQAQAMEILRSTADALPNLDKFTQGKGRIDPAEAIQKAEKLAKLEAPGKAPAEKESLLKDDSDQWLVS